MRTARHQLLQSESARGLPCRVELREWRVRRVGPGVTVRRINSRQMNASCRHVGDVDFHVAEIMIDACRPTPDITVPEILRDSDDGQQLHLIARSERIQVALKARQIDPRIGRYVLHSAGCENRLSLHRIGRGQSQRYECIVKRNRNSRQSSDVRRKRKRN